jgi:hypothetical protein
MGRTTALEEGIRVDAAPTGRQGPGEVNLGTTSGDPDEVTVSTTDPDKVTVWLGATGATDRTRRDAEEWPPYAARGAPARRVT